MNERVDALPHERLLKCFYHPEEHRGGIETVLAESYAPRR
jgi:xylose isomerase